MTSAASPPAEVFSVPAFLAAVAGGAVPDATVLEALCRKIEVARKVHETYDATLREPTSPALLPADRVEALGAVFLDAAERTGDAKWLNCVLKLQNGVLQAPAFSGTAALEARIARLLAAPLPACAT